MSKLRLRCPKCQERLEISREDAGSIAECGACGKKFRLPPAPPPRQALAVVTPVPVSHVPDDEEPGFRDDEDCPPDAAPRRKKAKRSRRRSDPWGGAGGLKEGLGACCFGLVLSVLGILWVAVQTPDEKGEFTIPLYFVAGPTVFAFGVISTLGTVILGPPTERQGVSGPHFAVKAVAAIVAVAVFAITAYIIELH
jgi:hypothetical protein